MKHLIFQLYGPMASWGEIAVGEHRRSDLKPSKSSIVGLLGAALGIRRSEDDLHRRLSDAYGIAVRIDARGELLRDYHTTQVPPATGKKRYYTRKDEIAAEKLGTILSERDYRVDASYTVALWQNIDAAPYSLQALANALLKPRFILYLGRKSCPLALPVHAQVVDVETLIQAFGVATFPTDFLNGIPFGDLREYVWEKHPASGISASMVYPRRDHVLSRTRWQFRERDEYYTAVSREEDQ